jgi:hypothetical protein
MRCTGKRSRSRDAFFVRTRVIGTPFPKTTPPTRPSSDAPDSGTAGRTTIGRGARRFVGWAKARNAPCPRVSQNAFLKTVFLKTAWASLRSTHPTKRTKTKGSRTPTDAGLPASPSGEARTLARARSPVGVPLRLSPGRQLVPKAQRQAMLSGTVRSVRSCTAAPTGERRPCASPCMIRKRECRFSGKIPAKDHAPLAGVTRAGTNPSAVSTSHAGHCAGRLMPDAARVQRGRTLCPRAPDPLPPAIRHPAGVLYEERDKGLLFLVAGLCQEKPRR